MRKLLLFLFLLAVSASFAQYYQVSLVRANDSNRTSLVYDHNSSSYKDNSIENPDVLLRICGVNASEMLNHYAILAYAGGTNAGDYLEVDSSPVSITSLPPNLCVNLPIAISAFRAPYPAIPYVFIGTDAGNFSSASRWKLSRTRGWFRGNYTANATQANNTVNVTVINATDHQGNIIPQNVRYLVIGLLTKDNETTANTTIAYMNETVNLSLGSYTGNYSVVINGIGAIDDPVPPYVHIYDPRPTAYSSGTIPFNFIITDNEQVDSCWYTLNGARMNLPSCETSYILSLSGGSYLLVVYANDTSNNIGSDSVSFTVAGGGGAPGGGTPGTGGAAGTPYKPPVAPVIPPSVSFTISAESLYLKNDYPHGATGFFSLRSNIPLYDVKCAISGDFGQWSTVTLSSDRISNDTPVNGTIYVDLTAARALTYAGSTSGLMQCTAKYEDSLSVSATSNIYLVVQKPELKVSDVPFQLNAGSNGTVTVNITNTGNAPAFNLSVYIGGPNSGWLTVESVPGTIQPGETKPVVFRIQVPPPVKPDQYAIPFGIDEFGIRRTDGNIRLDLLAQIVVPPITKGAVCHLPYGTRWLDASAYGTSLLVVLCIANFVMLWTMLRGYFRSLPYSPRRIFAVRVLSALALPVVLLALGLLVDPCLSVTLAVISLVILFAIRQLIQHGVLKIPKS